MVFSILSMYILIERDDLVLNFISVLISILELQSKDLDHQKPDFLSYATNT